MVHLYFYPILLQPHLHIAAFSSSCCRHMVHHYLTWCKEWRRILVLESKINVSVLKKDVAVLATCYKLLNILTSDWHARQMMHRKQFGQQCPSLFFQKHSTGQNITILMSNITLVSLENSKLLSFRAFCCFSNLGRLWLMHTVIKI